MKLVAAAKVRRAQDAVINGRPFAENLVKVGRTSMTLLHNKINFPTASAYKASSPPTTTLTKITFAQLRLDNILINAAIIIPHSSLNALH